MSIVSSILGVSSEQEEVSGIVERVGVDIEPLGDQRPAVLILLEGSTTIYKIGAGIWNEDVIRPVGLTRPGDRVRFTCNKQYKSGLSKNFQNLDLEARLRR